MKKLYFLNEAEKERILKLHEERTKKQYLGEQATAPISGGVISQEQKDQFEYILNISPSKFQTIFSDLQSRSIVYKIIDFCTKLNAQPSKNDVELKKIIYSIGSAMENGRYSGLNVTGSGRGVTQDTVVEFEGEILKFENVPNFCKAVNLSKRMNVADEDNIMYIFDEISSNTEFAKIIASIQTLLNNTKTSPSTTTPTGWDKYPCVAKHPNVEKTGDPNILAVVGSKNLKGIKVYYNVDGTFYYEGMKTPNQRYECAGNQIQSVTSFKTGTGSGTGGGTTVQPWGSATSSAPKLLAVKSINQDTINQMAQKLGI